MGDLRLMPPYLRRWYEAMFGGNPQVEGPRGIPGPAPPNWRQGVVPGRPDREMPPARPESFLTRIQRWLRARLG
jgi:hypothetical protein